MALPASQPSIDTCTACGKLFPRVSMRLCSGCAMVEEHRFDLVRNYVKQHDGANVIEIAQGTGVSGGDVRRFLEGGRLVEVGGAICTCGGVGERCRHCRSHLSGKLRDLEATMTRDLADNAGDEGTGRTSYVRRIRRIDGDR
jgi:predicted  nucleic acid-binding Zn-ribbon protein